MEESSLDGSHLVISCTLSNNENIIHTHALIDTGASGYAFIDENFARHHKIPLSPLRTPRHLEVIDGRAVSSGQITHLARLGLTIKEHKEQAPFFVTTLGHYPLVLGIPWMKHHDIGIRFSSNTLSFGSEYCKKHCTPSSDIITTVGLPPEQEPIIKIKQVNKAAFACLKEKGLYIFAISLKDINEALEANKKIRPDPRLTVPPEYHEYLSLFSEAESNKLPPRRKYDHKIILQEGKEPPFGPLYGMGQDELKVMKEYLESHLKKDFIEASSSPAGAPVLFVKKPGGGLRFCVDYRGLNELTIKNRYPLPLLRETLDRLTTAKWYTKLDLTHAYNLVRIAKGDEWKTAFRTRLGHYQYKVMPFGLTNAPATFQHFINDTLFEYLDIFCTAFIDDILIYSDTLDEHKKHVRKVLQKLKSAALFLEPSKCQFHVQETTYLGLIISPKGISMDPKKVSSVQSWETPRTVKEIQAFIGFANFYRRFIKDFSKICAPMTALTRKDTKFEWAPECETAFHFLKNAFCSAPILMHFDPNKQIIVETDASDYVSAAILSQHDDQGTLRPVAFFSKKHTPAECNYEIYDKELLAIIKCFEEWRPELEGSTHPILVISDHRNLEYFMTKKQLNRRQARWSEFLSRFNYRITYRPGKQGGKPDALTRRSGDLPKEGDERLLHQSQTVLKKENVDPKREEAKSSLFTGSLTNEPAQGAPTFQELFQEAYETDPFPRKILQLLKTGASQSKEITLAECTNDKEQLKYRGRTYVPDLATLHLRILQDYHDAPAAGHPGRAKTLELIGREYFWPKMRQYVDQYVRNCHTCSRSKATHHAPHGVLRPLPVPERPWQDISMDFVTGLPTSNEYDAILVVVDRLSKMRHLIPCHTTANAEDVAKMFLNSVWKLHGLPNSIISDRGTQFTSNFWKKLCHLLRIEPKLSSAFHPQTDGQTERMNAVMEQYLRCFVSYQQDDWADWLPMAEFAANNAISDTTQTSPFFANYGFNPRFNTNQDQEQGSLKQEEATLFAKSMNQLHDHLRAEMKRAQIIQADNADTHRIPAPNYQVGDEVWLSAKNIRTTRPTRKLDWKRLGRFKIKKTISPYAYELDLPASMKIHPVFHVSLLDPVNKDPVPGQILPPPPPVEVEGEEEFEIEEVLDSRMSRRKLQYLIKWRGYDAPTWEPATSIDLDNSGPVNVFHHLFPQKPKPINYQVDLDFQKA